VKVATANSLQARGKRNAFKKEWFREHPQCRKRISQKKNVPPGSGRKVRHAINGEERWGGTKKDNDRVDVSDRRGAIGLTAIPGKERRGSFSRQEAAGCGTNAAYVKRGGNSVGQAFSVSRRGGRLGTSKRASAGFKGQVYRKKPMFWVSRQSIRGPVRKSPSSREALKVLSIRTSTPSKNDPKGKRLS